MKNLRQCLLRVAGLFLAVALLPGVEVDPQQYLAHIKYLAGPNLRGRGNGTPELNKSASYVAKQFNSVGLIPVSGRSYYEPFPVTTNARLGKKNSLSVHIGTAESRLAFRKDFVPFNFSASGKVSGEMVFAGYGITASEYGYDDYAGIVVKDKVVVILRHEPQEFDENSVFEGKVYTEHAQFFSKAVNARMHGARAVLLVNDSNAHTGSDADRLEKFGQTAGPNNAGIPFIQVGASVASAWFRAAGRDLAEIQKGIDQDLKPRSFAFPSTIRTNLNVEVMRDLRTVYNVLGYLPGESPEYVVIGAHYDHLGLGEQFSMAPDLAGTPHPGADDNASGTAGVIELARWFTSRPKPKRGILFMVFAGEELGLLGSSYYVNHPLLPLGDAVAMINLDMIGRIRNEKVYIAGSGTGSVFQSLLKEPVAQSGLVVDYSDKSGYGSSDHTSFTTKQVPVLFFFSGLHGDYHRPSDTWDKIDAPEAAKLLKLVGGFTEELLVDPERPKFVRVAEPAPNPHAGMSSAGGSSGYGPYFGSIPDFADVESGVRFADIRKGSPAEQAGLKAGDILVEFDGKTIQNLYDFTYTLRSKKVGDEVAVKVLRGKESITATVRLAERK